MLYKNDFVKSESSFHTGINFTGLKLCSLLLVFICFSSYAQTRILDSSTYLLRIGDQPEWEEFANTPANRELNILFNAHNKTEHTLSLRQYDVKQTWNILLNDHKVGILVTDGNEMRTYYTLPREALKNGENKLTIQAATNNPDDIVLREITLYERPLEKVLTEATVHIEVTDRKTNKPLPARITIVDAKKILQTTGTKPADHLAIRPGSVYTGNGKASLLIPPGNYLIYASRGSEYGVDSATIHIQAGQNLRKKLTINREVETDGWIGSDTHIHTLTHSGHGDASDRERALTIAAEGIELAIITEHNVVTNFEAVAKETKMNTFFTTVPGDEVTTAVGHFNVFPLTGNATIPNHRAKNWGTLAENLPASDNTVVILNHGRDIHNDFRPFDPKRHIAIAGVNRENWTLPANAMEVINSGALQDDPMRLFHDWFGLLNRGFLLTPAGASDSHDVSRYLVGQARTYIRGRDNQPGKIDIEQAARNFKEGKVMVSFGLLSKVIVNTKFGPGDLVPSSKETIVDVEVAGPGWVKAKRVCLYANGIKIRDEEISTGNAAGTKWKGQWKLLFQKQDAFLVVIAEGDGNPLPFWPIVKPFQPVSPVWKPYTIGSSGAIWIDADGDGKPTHAYAYAKKLISSAGANINKLFKEMEAYDEAVAVQAAALLQETGVDLSAPLVVAALSQASASVKEGFRKFSEATQESKEK